MNNIQVLVTIARTLHKLKRLAAKMGRAELSQIIGAAALLAMDIVQGANNRA